MENNVDNVGFDESSVENKGTSRQIANFLEEIKDLDNKARDPNYKTYKKSTYWNQQTGIIDEVKQEAFQKELMECLLRIEAILIKIETSFKK